MDWLAIFRVDEVPEPTREQLTLTGWLALFKDRLEASQKGRAPEPFAKFTGGKRRKVDWKRFFRLDDVPETQRAAMDFARWEKHFKDKHERLEKAEKNLSSLRKSLDKQPDSVAARAELGEALELTGSLEEAARLFSENARALDGDGLFLKAIRFVERSLRCVEYQPEAWLRLGSLQESLGHFGDAEATYGKLLALAQARNDSPVAQRCEAALARVRVMMGS